MLITRLSDIPKHARIALYGAGQQGCAFFKTLQLTRPDVEVTAFIDENPTPLSGLPAVVSPAKAASTGAEFIVLTLANTVTAKQHLHNQGCTLPIATMPDGVNTVQHFFPQEANTLKRELEAATKHLDPSCRPLYGKLLSARIIPAKNNVAPWPQHGRQYLDFIDSQSIKTVIEAGVFRGVNTRCFLNEFSNLEHLYGFEPCPAPNEQVANDQIFVQNHPKCTLIRAGLWDQTDRLWLEPDSFASHINPYRQTPGATCVDVVSIDGFCAAKNIAPDFIKLDIEGAEPKALQGALKTITAHRPQLAISIYHTKHQFYSIINLCAQIVPTGYRFYLGHYSTSIEETILYAIPEKTLCP